MSKKCRCGCTEFVGHQLCRMDVIVDADNQFSGNVEGGIYDAETPFGPYTCTECGAEYDSLDDLPDQPGNTRRKTAKDIRWDVDDPADLEFLPEEIVIPEGMSDKDEISDYISDVTGFCHKGFVITEME